ncbi:MAG: DUF4912 domain-containing protein [Candidatus Omnitrophota bacterium]
MGLFQGWKKKSEDRRAKKKNSPEETAAHKRRLLAMSAAARTQEKIAPLAQSAKTKNSSSIFAARHGPPAHPSPKVEVPQRSQELPDDYGDNQIYLLIRDPFWLYAYWEIQKDHQEGNLKKLGGSWDRVVSVLRVYDVTDKKKGGPFFNIILQNMARSWYINTQPNRSYYVEIGLSHRDGRFICLARSNWVTTPRSGMSEVIDEQWMGIDFDKMYALSGGFQVGKSSAELQKLMEERLKSAISSGSGVGAVSSLSSPVKVQKRGFYFWLECELIIYGGTEHDAKVTMQGRPVQLRPDGTFTLRYGLPDGKFIFDCRAESSDGIEERVMTPVVNRHTERPAPIFKTAPGMSQKR